MARPIQLGLIQMSCEANPERNLEKAVNKIRQAAAEGAQLICLQELFRSLYFCQDEDVGRFDLAEPIPGPSTRTLAELARELGIVIVASLFERRGAGLYHNTAVLLEKTGEIAGIYRKMHIPDDPHYYEKFYFTPGDLGFRAFRTSVGNVGVLVCWDQWFPEAARLTALAGAEILLYPTAIGWLGGQSEETNRAQWEAWETVQRGHAIANGVFLAAVNRVGPEENLTFWGRSFVADPFGRILARAPGDEEAVLVVECDLERVERIRREWCFLRDRRVDAYDGLTKLWLDPEEA
ncbi:MAG: carbon-nitrogen hydrolase [Acidobacteriota bacterium]